MSWLTIILVVLSLMVGGCSGLLIATLLVAARDADEQMEKLYKENTYE